MYIAKEPKLWAKEVQVEEEETLRAEFSERELNLPLFEPLLSRKNLMRFD